MNQQRPLLMASRSTHLQRPLLGIPKEGYPVTGNGPANAAIEILNEAGDVVGTGTTDENGDYTITLTSEDVAPEEKLIGCGDRHCWRG